jgi:hypothetical protein
LLGVVHGVVHVLGRGNIGTSGHSTSDMREQECEYECSEVDHWVVNAQKITGVGTVGLSVMRTVTKGRRTLKTRARCMLDPMFAPKYSSRWTLVRDRPGQSNLDSLNEKIDEEHLGAIIYCDSEIRGR